jgi:UDP-3-O-[3-hydroxymyristoyl] glucosamine N-acyltransferase
VPEYRYELRRGDAVIATGHWSVEQSVEVGERISIGGQSGVVRSVEPRLGEHELHLIVQVARDGLPPR